MKQLFLILCLFVPNWGFAAPSIRLPKKVAVSGPVILLGDVALLRGFSSEERTFVSDIELGRSPAVGRTKFVPRAYLKARILEAGVQEDTKILLPRRLKVERKTRVVSGKTLSDRVRERIREQMPHSHGAVAEVAVPHISDMRIPEDAHFEVRFARGEGFTGPVFANIVLIDGDETISTRKVSARVDLLASVYALREDQKRGHRLALSDLVELRVAESTLPSDAVRHPELIVGAKFRRRSLAGEPLRDSWLEVPPLVARGERVRLVATRGGIRLSTLGESLSAGAAGAFVRVRNLSSRKVVTGRVSGPGIVEMEF